MRDSCLNNPLRAHLLQIAAYLEFLGTSASFRLVWSRGHRNTLRKDEFLVYAACYGLSKYVLAALGKRETCYQLKSDILLTISARIAHTQDPSQDDIELVEELLHQGADPNFKGYVLSDNDLFSRRIASPFGDLLTGILIADLHSTAKLSIRRLCHVMDRLLGYGANTSDLVHVRFFIQDSGKVEFISASKYRLRVVYITCGEKGEGMPKICSLLDPAFILIDALTYRLEEALRETKPSGEKCCDIGYATAVRVKRNPINTAASPRVIALSRGDGESNCRAVSDEDSIYLSDAVVKLLTNPRPQDATAMLGDRFLEEYQRSERWLTPKAWMVNEEMGDIP